MKQGIIRARDVGARQRRQHEALQTSGRRARELDFRKGVAIDVKSRLEKGYDASRPDDGRRPADHRRRIALMDQDEPSDRRIEGRVGGQGIVAGDRERHIAISGLGRTPPREIDRALLPVNANDGSRRSDRLSEQEGDVSRTRAEIEHAHARTNARFPDQSAREAFQTAGLQLQSLKLGLGARRIVRRIRHEGTPSQ